MQPQILTQPALLQVQAGRAIPRSKYQSFQKERCTPSSRRGFEFDGDCNILECLLGESSDLLTPDPIRHPALGFCFLNATPDRAWSPVFK